MKYAILLRSRHTGEEIYLGTQYDTKEEAEQVAKYDICERCNSYSIYQIQDGLHWINKHIGFQSGYYNNYRNYQRICFRDYCPYDTSKFEKSEKKIIKPIIKKIKSERRK